MAAANSPSLTNTSNLGSTRALNTLAAFVSSATTLESYMKHPVVASKLGSTIILDAAPAATQSQATHNLMSEGTGAKKAKVAEAKALLDDSCKNNPKLKYESKTGAYSTVVDGLLAVQAFAEIWKEYDGAAAELKSYVTTADGTKVSSRTRVAKPFDTYSQTIEDKIGAAQRASTLTFDAWLKDSTTLPITAKLVKEVEKQLGLADPQMVTFKRAHLLRYPTKAGSLFKMHSDHGDFPLGQAPHITANILISPSNVSEFQIAGYDAFKYDGPSSVAAFPSGLYHASGRCDARKVLLVLMWRLTTEYGQALDPKAMVDLTSAGPASEESAPPATVKAEPETEPEPEPEPASDTLQTQTIASPVGDSGSKTAAGGQAVTDSGNKLEAKPDTATPAAGKLSPRSDLSLQPLMNLPFEQAQLRCRPPSRPRRCPNRPPPTRQR